MKKNIFILTGLFFLFNTVNAAALTDAQIKCNAYIKFNTNKYNLNLGYQMDKPGNTNFTQYNEVKDGASAECKSANAQYFIYKTDDDLGYDLQRQNGSFISRFLNSLSL